MVAGLESAAVELRWLRDAPVVPLTAVTTGVPWPRGAMSREQTLTLATRDGAALPVQTWPLAFWPDGSVKWSALATVIPAGSAGPFSVAVAPPVVASVPNVMVREDTDAWQIDTGVVQARVAKTGPVLIESLTRGGREIARDGRLMCWLQQGPDDANGAAPARESFASIVETVTLEQRGPVRAVVKIEGRHRAENGGRTWLPFVVRLYFHAGLESVRVVHTFIFDGDQERDFIRGLGLRFAVPLRDELHNRHVRFAGEAGGVFAEPVRLIAGREPRDEALYARHLAGETMAPAAELPDGALIPELAAWDAFKLAQLSPDAFALTKRTGAHSAWIAAAAGARASGMVFIGDSQGGLAVGHKDFWQRAPTSLEVQGATTDAATVTAWLWSPDVPAMDLRTYDIVAHGLRAAYEDIEPGFATATGIARTSELSLVVYANMPSREDFSARAQEVAQSPRLVCSPEYYHSIGTFGYWSLPNRATAAQRQLEDQLDRMLAFYAGEIEQRRWYGFWDHGDIMHTYDPHRHTWKYDVGGFAWMNSEECPDLVFWYSFLRTGRAELFELAEAMTRHTSEVDMYHLGRFAGLGSRHAVRHWGDSAKEVRISQALYRRIYYYLTADERTGDIMRGVRDADYALVTVDPLRKILPRTAYPTHARSGPDWLACAGNWMTEWERTGDTTYRDKIITGMKSLAAMPRGLLTALSFAYDPATGLLHDVPDKQATGQFLMIMGGAEVAFELHTLLDVPEWNAAWLQVCEDWTRRNAGDMAGPRAAAFAAFIKNDPALGRRTWEIMAQPGDGTGLDRFPAQMTPVAGAAVLRPVDEVPKIVGSGHLSQWALNIITSLELAGRWLPADP